MGTVAIKNYMIKRVIHYESKSMSIAKKLMTIDYYHVHGYEFISSGYTSSGTYKMVFEKEIPKK